MNRRLRFASILTLTLTACGGSKPASDPSSPSSGATAEAAPAEKNADLKAQAAREAQGLTLKEVKGDGFSFVALSSDKSTVKKIDGGIEVEIPIGSSEAVDCTLLDEAPDAGAAVATLLKSIAEQGNLQIEKLGTTGLTVVGESPVMGYEAVYTIPQPGGKKGIGLFKMITQTRIDRTLVCTHDEIGYSQSFRQVAEKLFETFVGKEPAPSPSQVYIYENKLDGVTIGFLRLAVLPAKENQKLLMSSTLVAVPQSPTSISFNDIASAALVDNKGRIVSGNWASSAGPGEVQYQIKLERDKGNSFKYEGEAKGNPVKGEFRTKDANGLGCEISSAAKLGALAAKAGSFEQEEYAPSTNLTGATRIQYKHDKAAEANLINISGGGDFSGKIDASGWFEQLTIPAGEHKITAQRVFQRAK